MNTLIIRRWSGILASLVAVGIVVGALYIPGARSCTTNTASMEAMERVFELHIKDGMVARDMRIVRAWVGDFVRLRWTTDKPVVVHLHGYDIERNVTPGGVTEIVFKAHATGRFPIEVHGKGGAHGSGHHHGPLVIVEIYPR